jgi:hypothetical protein
MATDETASGAVEITEFQVKTLLDAGKNITQIAEFFGTNKWAIMRWFPELIRAADLPEGRPAKAIDPSVVATMAEEGATTEDIADSFDVSRDTIERRFMPELRLGRLRLRNKIKKKQIDMALAGDRGMLIWAGKQFCGQREKIEHTGLDGGAIAIDVGKDQDLSKLTVDELKLQADLLRKMAIAPAPSALSAPEKEADPAPSDSAAAGAA